jgi:hypothetical protein
MTTINDLLSEERTNNDTRDSKTIKRVLDFYAPTRKELALPNAGIDGYGVVIPYNRSEHCGDIMHFIDFETDLLLEDEIKEAQRLKRGKLETTLKQNKSRLGFTVIDAMGHDEGSAVEACILLNSILPAMKGDLSHYGQVTPKFLENVAASLRRSPDHLARSSTLMYGEVTHMENYAMLKTIRKGHPAPLIYRAGEGFDRQLKDKWINTGELPIALRADHIPPIECDLDKTDLQKGDIVVVYTDGLQEYKDYERIVENTIRKHEKDPLSDITTEIVHGLTLIERIDDTSIGLIRYSGVTG